MKKVRRRQELHGFRRVEVLLHEDVVEVLENQARENLRLRGEHLSAILTQMACGAVLVDRKLDWRHSRFALPWQDPERMQD